jgi:hypothetical protein
MSSFLRELQNVYTEGYGGDITYPPIMARGQKVPMRSDISYYGLPGTQPGQGNPSMPSVTIPYEAEEESVISKSILRSKITELLNQAEEKGMGYAFESLYDLLHFIDKN